MSAADTGREKVASMCKYITDDNWIAKYLGCSVGYVRKIRAELPKNGYMPGQGGGSAIPENVAAGLDNERATKKFAQLAADSLNKRMWAYYARRAAELKIPVREAMVVAGGMRA